MNTKNKIMNKYLLLLLVLVGLSGCADLDISSDGRLQLKDIFGDYMRTKAYYGQCYYYMNGDAANANAGAMFTGFNYDPTTMFASYSDEAQDASDGMSNKVNTWYSNASNATDFPIYDNSYWANMFNGIYKCNTFLTCMNDPDMATASMGTDERNGMLGEIHTLRAFFYLQLIKRYGGVPLRSTPYEADHDYSQDKRATFEECVDYIIADCDSALALPEAATNTLGFRWTVASNEGTRFTRGVAWAIKSEAALYAASPLWNTAGSKYTWAEAEKITKAALDACLAHGYRLFDTAPEPDVAQNTYENYFNVIEPDPARSIDPETIYRSPVRMTVWNNAGTPLMPGQVKAGPCPSQELVDAYETSDGQPVLNLSKPYNDADHLVPNYNTANNTYDPANPYENRDPRFYASIYYNGAPRSLAGAGSGGTVTLPLNFNTSCLMNDATVTENADGSTTIKTTGGDGWVLSTAMDGSIPTGALSRKIIFEYKSNKANTQAEFFWAFNGGFWGTVETYFFEIPQASDWATFEYDLDVPNSDGNTIDYWGWGTFGEAPFQLRFDVSTANDYEITVRNFRVECEVVTTPSNPVETFVGGNSGINLDPSSIRFTRTGYYLRKFNNYKSNADTNIDGFMRIFRLGELYLNYAEAAYNNGNLTDARIAVNAVRTRAGMPGLSNTLTKEQFELRYRNERRIELAFEEHRFYDVRRWKILSETDKFVTGMQITKDDNGVLTYQRIRLNNRGTNADKYLMFPIPQTEAIKMLNYTGVSWQNPGWQ
jgi:hypothetical protein